MRMYEVKKYKVVDVYTDSTIGYGWFIVELIPRNGRLRFVEMEPDDVSKMKEMSK